METMTLNADLHRWDYETLIIRWPFCQPKDCPQHHIENLTQNATTNDWSMDINMDQCGIIPVANDSSIYFPLTIKADSADPDAIIYRETPGFKIGFKCYFQREMKFSGGGWKVTADNITDITLGTVNHCRKDLDRGH